MNIQKSHPILDDLFALWKSDLGRDFRAYRNHAFRVFNIAIVLSEATGENAEKLAVASAFHDVGIWLDSTFDYLGPSIARAREFLNQRGLEDWTLEVTWIIEQHHKIRPWKHEPSMLVEAFRRADWLDVSLFWLPTTVSRGFLSELLEVFPRAGFHRRLVDLTFIWAKKHPFRPLPMFKL